MTIIPSTFNTQQINRTVLGGNIPSSNVKMNVSVIMLNKSGSHLRVPVIENLSGCGFKHIIWVEPFKDSFNIEDVSRRFPQVKFVLPAENATDGELINACVGETDAEYFIVLRDSLHIPQNFLSANLFESITREKIFSVVPRLVDPTGDSVSVNVYPEAKKGRFIISNSQFVSDRLNTLFPRDFIALYNREKFIQLGGYDYTITSSYWQNADLGLRSWLWGEKTEISTSFTISYAVEPKIEDTTRDYSYLRFYLKNILPVFKEDHGVIKFNSFINFKNHSSCGFFDSFAQFKCASNWVELNKYRFKMDVQTLMENWISGK